MISIFTVLRSRGPLLRKGSRGSLSHYTPPPCGTVWSAQTRHATISTRSSLPRSSRPAYWAKSSCTLMNPGSVTFLNCSGGAPAPGWSNAAKMATWAASSWRAAAFWWDMRRWGSPPESVEQPQAFRCSLMRLRWPATASQRRHFDRVVAPVEGSAAAKGGRDAVATPGARGGV